MTTADSECTLSLCTPRIDRSGLNARYDLQDKPQKTESPLVPSEVFVFHSGSSVAERPSSAAAERGQVDGAIPSPSTPGVEAQPGSASKVMISKVAGSNPANPTQLYVVVDSALSPGAKACQAAHALRAYADAYPNIERQWWATSNTLVLLETSTLETLELKAHTQGISCVRFVEPDWAPEGTLTALVLGPEGRKLVSSLKLAFC